MAKKRLTDDLREILVNEYVDFQGTNDQFFDYIVEKDPRFAEFSAAQLRGYLVFADVYNPTSPRPEKKKGGKKKADYAKELTELLESRGVLVSSVDRLLLTDIQTLIEFVKTVSP